MKKGRGMDVFVMAATLGAFGLTQQSWADDTRMDQTSSSSSSIHQDDTATTIQRSDIETSRSEMGTSGSQLTGKSTFKASELLGMNVYNARNETIGQIQDVIVDFRSGRSNHIIIDSDSGLGKDLVAIPMDRFSMNNNQDNHVVLNLEQSQLAAAPRFDENAYTNDPHWFDSSDRYFMGIPSVTLQPTGVNDPSRSYDTGPNANPGSSSDESSKSSSSTGSDTSSDSELKK